MRYADYQAMFGCLCMQHALILVKYQLEDGLLNFWGPSLKGGYTPSLMQKYW